VYVSSSLSLALVETLVHLPGRVLSAFSAVSIEFDATDVEELDRKLPTDWTVEPPAGSTQAIGDAFVAGGRRLALRVPSVVVPSEWNYVLNPRHPRFAAAKIGKPTAFPFDRRLAH
jgi:RES domain-containing protein